MAQTIHVLSVATAQLASDIGFEVIALEHELEKSNDLTPGDLLMKKVNLESLRAGVWKEIAEKAIKLAGHYEDRQSELDSDSGRSIPGQEEMVNIFVIGPTSEWADAGVGAIGETEIYQALGPDFADCRWPTVLKVKPGIPKSQLVAHLRDLIRSLEDGSTPELMSKQSNSKSHPDPDLPF